MLPQHSPYIACLWMESLYGVVGCLQEEEEEEEEEAEEQATPAQQAVAAPAAAPAASAEEQAAATALPDEESDFEASGLALAGLFDVRLYAVHVAYFVSQAWLRLRLRSSSGTGRGSVDGLQTHPV